MKIERTHTKTCCQKCGSANVDWKLNVHDQPAWGVCLQCGATVEIKEVLTWRKRIANAFAKIGLKGE